MPVLHLSQRENRELWTAETPVLYDITFELFCENKLMEVHSKRAGFVTSAVKGGRFLINGKPVRIRGRIDMIITAITAGHLLQNR